MRNKKKFIEISQKKRGAAMRIIEELGEALSGGSYKCEFQIHPLMLQEKLDVYPKEIFAISGAVPNALGFVLRRTQRLVESWIDVEPEKLYEFDRMNCIVKPLLHGKMPILNAPAVFKGSKTLEDVIRREVDFDEVLASPIVIWIGTLDLKSGKVVWFSNKDSGMTPGLFTKIVFASMRIPVFFPPLDVEANGVAYQLVDAGGVNNLPVDQAVARGFKKIIAINSMPRELLPVSRLDIIPEIDVRAMEAKHFDELGSNVERIKRINRNVNVVEKSREILEDPRVPDDVRRSLAALWEGFTFEGKRHIELCLLHPPSKLRIFQKDGDEMYGAPSAEARFELLGAGVKAAEFVLLPFLKEQGLITASEELKEAFRWRPAVDQRAIKSLIKSTASKRIWSGLKEGVRGWKKPAPPQVGKTLLAIAMLILSMRALLRRQKKKKNVQM